MTHQICSLDSVYQKMCDLKHKLEQTKITVDAMRKRSTYLATHQINGLTDLFANGRTPSMTQHKTIKMYFKDFEKSLRL